MQYSNLHLVEVNCGFQFHKETTPWDSTFFGRFYEKIIKYGFKGKEERKGFQVKFGIDARRNLPISPTSEIEDQVIFKNNDGMAILMAKNKISFHIVRNYTIWEDFVSKLIKPFSEIYRSLELGNGERNCNLIYLNKFVKPSTGKLSDYFTIVSPLNEALDGIEINTVVQRVVDNGKNLLIAKLNSQLNNNMYNINLECGSMNKDSALMNGEDWIDQANKTHKPVNDFFESIITQNLRDELSK